MSSSTVDTCDILVEEYNRLPEPLPWRQPLSADRANQAELYNSSLSFSYCDIVSGPQDTHPSSERQPGSSGIEQRLATASKPEIRRRMLASASNIDLDGLFCLARTGCHLAPTRLLRQIRRGFANRGSRDMHR
ncbi:methylenetetrahydrofolate reductase [Pseudozyma hubeiensis SY62]|uniref:Methylenetetrahydrofolate reductase n=1 Tax=Pseudozyma hubeiensis (strain SY62) TaxID=1305764 RepID=R9PCM9_PSEHS|nr:methylenetetrahydrofolate reductase [Pseudozyma hubeiensis SY62]GAC99126.1 methylenetetrahydrofolate reductase [Pseudozyma hubeiensis SY62]